MKSLVDSDYLKRAAEIFQPIKQRSFELMAISPGHRVLDVGCGTGADLLALNNWMPGVDAIGVDADPDMVMEAKSKSDYIQAYHDTAESLGFKDHFFHSVRAERVFMHLDDPDRALNEMARVTKPGGRVVVVETDWTSLTVACCNAVMEREINDYRVSCFIENGLIGRQLYGMFKRRLEDVKVEVVPLITHRLAVYSAMTMESEVMEKALEACDVGVWRDDLSRRDQAGEFFANVNVLIVSGTKV